MRVNTVAQDLGCSIDEAQEAIDNNQVNFDLRTGRYYLRSSINKQKNSMKKLDSIKLQIEDVRNQLQKLQAGKSFCHHSDGRFEWIKLDLEDELDTFRCMISRLYETSKALTAEDFEHEED